MIQHSFILNLLKKNPKAIFIGSLGTICYDLTKILESGLRRDCYLIRGGMGCALGIALGYALSSRKKVICIIGDGAFIMKQGSVSTIMAHKPKNLKVYIMVNNKYASTGGQKINSINPRPLEPIFRICRVS